jgi:hypothetical protein
MEVTSMTPFQAIDAFHTPDTLISPGQAFAIGSAIAASGEKPNVLVFGCGNDTALWCAMNENGYVLFLENNAGWLERTRQRFPHAKIEPIAYGDTTVATSLPISEDKLAAVPVPEAVRRCVWDVILVDSPRGYKPHDPGRSLSIYWTSQVAGPRTQIFIDDYDRLLERDYTNHLSGPSASGTFPFLAWSKATRKLAAPCCGRWDFRTATPNPPLV